MSSSGRENEVDCLYWANEQKCRALTKNMFKYYLMFNESSIVASFLFSIVMVLTGNFDASKIILPFTLSVPFETDSIWGWYSLWFIQLNISIAYASTMIGITSYFICCCLYVSTICDHLELVMQSTAQINYDSREKGTNNYRQYSLNVQTNLQKAIGIHANAIE